jgi:hypothetical protein
MHPCHEVVQALDRIHVRNSHCKKTAALHTVFSTRIVSRYMSIRDMSIWDMSILEMPSAPMLQYAKGLPQKKPAAIFGQRANRPR